MDSKRSTICQNWILILFVALPIISCQQINNMLEYNLLEEDPGGTIANIPVDSGITQIYAPAALQVLSFRFLSQSPAHQDKFEISENGILRSVASIDRDAICHHSTTCDIQFDIATEPREYFHIIKVTIHIIDLNDNAPHFDENAISLTISETTLSGTSFALPSAYDADIGQFGIQSFALEPQLVNFALDANINPDGSLDLHLILANTVDREINQYYNLRVVAWDGGDPVKSGTLNIDITLIDSNDNNPKFLNNTYQVIVDENIGVGRSIFQVQAYDPDEGQNGEIIYDFSRSTANSYGHLFGIDPSSGSVFTKDELDYETGSLYILSVMATDGGINPLSSYARLNVLVNDLNDNAPDITVNALHGLFAEIPENANINDFVAHVVIEDIDSGRNGEVTCSMNSQYFRFEYLYGNEYQIVTKAIFDREVQDEYTVELVCVDDGVSPQLTTEIIPVYITDMNDHEPVFEQIRYTVTVNERNSLQAYIETITANDGDIADNAVLMYGIQQISPVPRANFEVLTIDSSAGVIHANEIFDHEDIAEYEFIITARDGGTPPFSASTTLQLIIGDINDEVPMFSQSEYVFGTYENQAPDTEIGTLLAIDRDGSPQFREITFNLDPRVTDISTFGIDSQTGKIVAKKVLDREANAEYHLMAVAFNAGYSLSSSVNITIHVVDKNDNAPMFHFPTSNNNTVEIKGNHEVGDIVTQIVASDLDTTGNGGLIYDIVFGNYNDYFEINSFNGEIVLQKQLASDTFNKVLELVILVEDGGNPSLSATESLNVFVNGSFTIPASASKEDDSSSSSNGNDIAIIIICVLIFLIICIVLVLFTLFFLRRRSLQQSARENEPPKYDGHVETSQSLMDMNTSSNSMRSEFSDPASNKSFRGGNTISYISAEDAQTSNYQSAYIQQRLPTSGVIVDGYCPAGTLVSKDNKFGSQNDSAELQLKVPALIVENGGVEQECDNSSLTDSGKGSSEADAIPRTSPLQDMRKLPIVQKAGFVRDPTCSIYRTENPPHMKTSFQTYLTDQPHTTSCRQSPDRGPSIELVRLDNQKKSVHFDNNLPSSARNSTNNMLSNNTHQQINNYNTQDCFSKSRSLSCPPKSKTLVPPKKSSHISYEPDSMYYNNYADKKPYNPANKQVINLSQYLSERARDSDCDSQDGYSDGGTTTSGSYCMDDEDLAHDVLV